MILYRGKAQEPLAAITWLSAVIHTNKLFTLDPITGQSKESDAKKLWSREYAKGWEVKV